VALWVNFADNTTESCDPRSERSFERSPATSAHSILLLLLY